MKLLQSFSECESTKFIHWKDPLPVGKIIISGEAGSGIFGADGTSIIDENYNIDAPVTVSSLTLGTSGSPLTLTAGTPISNFHSTTASTSGSTSAEPFYLNSTMTGVGGVGGRARFRLDTNVALGGWSNALKAHTVYGATGKTTGLGSAFVAEMDLSAGTVDGNYAPLEVELNIPTGASLGTKTKFAHYGVQGADVTNMDDSGYFFTLNGLSVGSGKLFQANTAADATHALRIDLDGVDYFIMLTNSGA